MDQSTLPIYRTRDSYDQRLIESRLVITPEPVRMHWIHDPFGNCVDHL